MSLHHLRQMVPVINVLNARFALQDACDRGDSAYIKRFFRVIDIGSIIGGLFVAIIAICISIVMFKTAYTTHEEANRTIVSIPTEVGAPPAQSIVDETGFISDYHLEKIPDDLSDIASEYHIQVAIYSSFSPAHDVYNQFFNDENGVVLYVEEHESYGVLTYYWGKQLDDVFTADNIELLNAAQTYLNTFTHDRVPNVVYDFEDGLNSLFFGQEHAQFSAPYELATAVFWLIMSVVFFFLVRVMLCCSLHIPITKKGRQAYLTGLLTLIENNQNTSENDPRH